MTAVGREHRFPRLSEGDARAEQTGWYFYDWANSAFSSTVVTVFLGPYLTTITKTAAGADGLVHPFGLRVNAGSFFPYVVSLSVVLQVLFLPVLGAIADYSHRKKQLLGFFAYLGVSATVGLYFLHGTNYLLGGLLFLIANLSFGASVVIYNAFLPEIARPEERDDVSSKGWALGYLGGGLLLLLNLVLMARAADFGLDTGHAVRINLASAGVWWGLFSIIPLAALRTRQPIRTLPRGAHYLTVGFRQLRGTVGMVMTRPQTLLFLSAYLLYNDGIQAVITLSTEFGQEELKLSLTTLSQVILMVQFVAFAGAIGFNYVARAAGAQRAILASLLIWSGALIYAYAWLRTEFQFFMLAAVIAVVLGGSQALSRSLYSLMIPKGREAEYFSLYEISERGTSWLGPLLFGLSLQFTGSYRFALMSLIVFFIAGLLLLSRLDVRAATAEASAGEGASSPE
ncbi:MAG TPA: MFS transporter [Nitrospiria bacterium]|nr:MFS transporter [Nitrospiria bacterium]